MTELETLDPTVLATVAGGATNWLTRRFHLGDLLSFIVTRVPWHATGGDAKVRSDYGACFERVLAQDGVDQIRPTCGLPPNPYQPASPDLA